MSVRQEKVSDSIKRFVAELLCSRISDPRLTCVTITGVEISKDLKFAKIFFSSYREADKKDTIIKGLNSAKGFIKREIGKELKLRFTPELSFCYDQSPDYGAHIDSLFRKINDEK